MRLLSGLVVVAVLSAPGTGAEVPKRAWETRAPGQPESVFADAARNVLYVSNVAGDLTAKDGNGYLSKLSLDGSVITEQWVSGLDGPKGMALVGDRLFVSDIDQLVEVDVEQAKIVARHPADGAKFLNDVAADKSGAVYVSDTASDTIWKLDDSKLTHWLVSDQLGGPNGLLVDGDHLIVAGWGKDAADGKPALKGRLVSVLIADKSIKVWPEPGIAGNLDGLERWGDGYLVTEFMGGALWLVGKDGALTKLMDLTQSSADLDVVPTEKQVIIPFLKAGKIEAYRLP